MKSAPVILVVEDNEDDLYFMRRTLKAVAPQLPVRVAMDGQAALEYLRGTDRFADRAENPLPSVIFLDLKLPKLNGLDVLAAIRGDPMLQSLRVYILTSSSEDKDRSRAQELGVEGYLVKPPTPEMLRPIIGNLESLAVPSPVRFVES
jgi:CheY-like chemotaxis protein